MGLFAPTSPCLMGFHLCREEFGVSPNSSLNSHAVRKGRWRSCLCTHVQLHGRRSSAEESDATVSVKWSLGTPGCPDMSIRRKDRRLGAALIRTHSKNHCKQHFPHTIDKNLPQVAAMAEARLKKGKSQDKPSIAFATSGILRFLGPFHK
ncbi:unnamed protein product [Arabidopsis lyrata]|uniref:Predicted protein n=1 Tax=Arabidopsis lyrata subsp. lyrata TaxID=81972 RepID=D7KHE4_ARALL|nr:predicted protein [Arabidopsis lyrata subsp. lyrata]CAH8252850.1 unnamed protein product [Arabidopsis lyrata]